MFGIDSSQVEGQMYYSCRPEPGPDRPVQASILGSWVLGMHRFVVLWYPENENC